MVRNRYHHGDLRQQARRAALILLRDNGDAAVTLRALAKGLGVTAPALYRHFRDRQSLLADLASHGFRTLRHQLKQVPQDDPRQALIGIGLAYVAFAETNPNLYRLMFGGRVLKRGDHPDLDQAGKSAFAVLQDTTALAQRAGYLKADPLPTLTAAAWSLVHGLAQLTIDDHLHADHNAPELQHAIVALLLDGSRADLTTNATNKETPQ